MRPHRRLFHRLRDERGVVLVEFAIVLPVLLLVLLGIIDFGRVMNYSDQEQQMAAQAARWAAVNWDPGSQSIQQYVQTQALGGLGTTSGDVTSAAQVYLYYPTGSSNAVGNPIRACVVANVQLLPMLGSANLKLAEAATMRVETLGTTSSFTADSTTTAGSAGCPTS
jgi:Flp pilus assembly protein TadG